MANVNKNFQVKNGLDVKGAATIDSDLTVNGTLSAKTNTPVQDSDVVNKEYVDLQVADTHDSAAVLGQILSTVDSDYIEFRRPAETIFDLSPTVSGDYTFSGDGFPTNVNDPTLHLTRGKTYKFDNVPGSHPLEIRTSAGGAAYSSGVTNNGGSGTVLFTVPMDAPSTLFYQCTVHASMLGTIYIDDKVGVDSSQVIDLVDSAYVQARVDFSVVDFLDSGEALNLIDSDYVKGHVNQAYIDTLDTHDSAKVSGQIEAKLAGDVTVGGNLTVDGYIAGPTTMTIDPATVGTDSGTLVILGNLQVEGETTTVNSTTVSINDKNIVLADSATNATQANDAGLTINGANATMQYKAVGDKFEFNKPLYHGVERVLTTADDLHDSAKVAGQVTGIVDSAYVQARQITYDFLDSAEAINLFDSAYINARVDTVDGYDSAKVQSQIDSNFNDTVTITKHSTVDPALKLQTTVTSSDAGPIVEFVRNTNQASSGDYLGQIKFLGEDSSGNPDGSGVVYSKITGKIQDPTDGTEDGLIEFAVKSAGSNLILARMTGNSGGRLDILNGASIDVSGGGTITVNGNGVLTTATDLHDSAAVQGQIDSAKAAYTLAFVTGNGNTTTNDITVGKLTSDSAAISRELVVTGLITSEALNITPPRSTDAALQVGHGRESGGSVYVDLISSGSTQSYTDYGFRILRTSGDDGVTTISHRGIGNWVRNTQDGGNHIWQRNGTPEITLNGSGLTLSRYGAGTITGVRSKFIGATSAGLLIDVSDSDVGIAARHGFSAGEGLSYDSATGKFTSTAGVTPSGASSSFTVAIASLAGGLNVGAPVYYDSDTALWTGARAADSDYTASHVLVEKGDSNFKVASSGIFTVTGQSFTPNAYYNIGLSGGVAVIEDPDSGYSQTVFYAMDSNVLDIQMGDPQTPPIADDSDFVTVIQNPAITAGQTLIKDLLPIRPSTVDLFKNGILLVRSQDYTVDSQTAITVVTPLDDSDYISIRSAGVPAGYTNEITGTSPSAPRMAVAGDPDTGLYSDLADTLSIATGGQKRLKVSNTGTEITGHAKVGLVELADSNNVTYNISQGNIARWNRTTSPVDATNTLTFTGTAGGTLDGMGFSIMAFNGDDDSNRSITFAGDTGITIFYGDSSTITWAGPNQHTIISGLVFDSATVILNNIAMVGSV